eukprot:scaffold2338_cov301-Prasinococcus_capsulatus_cf.AAC.1
MDSISDHDDAEEVVGPTAAAGAGEECRVRVHRGGNEPWYTWGASDPCTRCRWRAVAGGAPHLKSHPPKSRAQLRIIVVVVVVAAAAAAVLVARAGGGRGLAGAVPLLVGLAVGLACVRTCTGAPRTRRGHSHRQRQLPHSRAGDRPRPEAGRRRSLWAQRPPSSRRPDPMAARGGVGARDQQAKGGQEYRVEQVKVRRYWRGKAPEWAEEEEEEFQLAGSKRHGDDAADGGRAREGKGEGDEEDQDEDEERMARRLERRLRQREDEQKGELDPDQAAADPRLRRLLAARGEREIHKAQVLQGAPPRRRHDAEEEDDQERGEAAVTTKG